MRMSINTDRKERNGRHAGAAVLLAFAGLLPVAMAQAGQGTAEAGHDSPAARIAEDAAPAVAVVASFSAALQAGDVDRATAWLADDVLILESGGAERSRAEYLSHHAAADAAFLKGAKVQVRHRTAHADGDTAWVATESDVQAVRDGRELVLSSTETMILRRSGGQWRIVHIHWSSRPKKQQP